MNTTKRLNQRGALLPLAAAALFALASHVQAAPRFAVKIADHDGSTLIAGEADGAHKDWIEVLSFGSGVRTGRDESGFPVAGTCEHQGFVIRKRIDKSSPLLARALTTGLLLPAVQAVYLGPDGSPSQGTEPVSVTLRHVQVTGYRMLGPVGGESRQPVPTEEITLAYTEVEWTYIKTSDLGQVIDTTSAVLAQFQATEDPTFDDDNDGVPNDLDLDDDNDGINDHDELNGGSNPFVDDAHEDLDGDGQDNQAELIANTRMNDSTDYFGIRKITHRRTPDGLQVTVSFPVSSGRHYRLLASPDPRIPREFWMVIDEFDVPEGSPETGADVQLNPNLLNNGRQLFFGAEVRMIGEQVDPTPVGPNPIDPIDPGSPLLPPAP